MNEEEQSPPRSRYDVEFRRDTYCNVRITLRNIEADSEGAAQRIAELKFRKSFPRRKTWHAARVDPAR